jgi:hypothetical protein
MRVVLLGYALLGMVATATIAAPADETTAKLASAVSLSAAVTIEEDPNDPTTMASLQRPFFVPDAGATALAISAMLAGLGLGWLWRQRAD